MHSDPILQMIENELRTITITNENEENIPVYLRKIAEIVEIRLSTPKLETKPILEKPKTDSDPGIIYASNTQPEIKEDVTENSNVKRGVFRRGLLNGHIEFKDNNKNDDVYRVYESQIKALELTEGDIVDVDKGKITIIEKAGDKNINTDLIEIPYAVLGGTFHNMYIEEYIEDGVPKRIADIDGLPDKLTPHTKDLDYHNATLDDIVDIAIYKNNHIARIRKRHAINPTLQSPQKSGAYKNNAPSDPVEQTLLGTTIAIFGGASVSPAWRDEIKKYGGNVVTTDSDVRSTIEKTADAADILVVPTLQTSHAKSIMANEIAKEKNKPILNLTGTGRTGFIREIHNELEKIRGEK